MKLRIYKKVQNYSKMIKEFEINWKKLLPIDFEEILSFAINLSRNENAVWREQASNPKWEAGKTSEISGVEEGPTRKPKQVSLAFFKACEVIFRKTKVSILIIYYFKS